MAMTSFQEDRCANGYFDGGRLQTADTQALVRAAIISLSPIEHPWPASP